jgi:prolyl oligopeptidase
LWSALTPEAFIPNPIFRAVANSARHGFDDFIAAGEWLIANHYTNAEELAIEGGSNGSLLVGASLTQRPNLFRTVICEYPLLNMLRFEKFLKG